MWFYSIEMPLWCLIACFHYDLGNYNFWKHVCFLCKNMHNVMFPLFSMVTILASQTMGNIYFEIFQSLWLMNIVFYVLILGRLWEREGVLEAWINGSFDLIVVDLRKALLGPDVFSPPNGCPFWNVPKSQNFDTIFEFFLHISLITAPCYSLSLIRKDVTYDVRMFATLTILYYGRIGELLTNCHCAL